MLLLQLLTCQFSLRALIYDLEEEMNSYRVDLNTTALILAGDSNAHLSTLYSWIQRDTWSGHSRYTQSLTAIIKILSTPIFDDFHCPFCSLRLSRDALFADHVSVVHLSQPLSDFISLLITGDIQLFSVVSELKRLYAMSHPPSYEH